MSYVNVIIFVVGGNFCVIILLDGLLDLDFTPMLTPTLILPLCLQYMYV